MGRSNSNLAHFELFIILYVAAINSIYFVLMVLGYFAVRESQRLSASELETLSTSPLLPSISILAPAYNESVSKFGVLGLFAFPYFVAFEIFGPIVELTGYIFTLLGLLLGVISPEIAALFFIVSVGFGMLLSISAVLLEQFTARRYPAARDVLQLVWVAVLENLGFRQLLTFWRAQGLIDVIRRKKGWGAMERRGFGTKSRLS